MKQTLREKLQSDLRDMIDRKEVCNRLLKDSIKIKDYSRASELKVRKDTLDFVIERLQYTLSNY